MNDTYDAVFVGSGINSLAGAALLAKEGRRVLVLERNDWLGGAIRTAEITEPGFVHEVFASWHPLFVGSAAYAELKDELRRARSRVPEHRAADRLALPGRVERLPDDVARGERGRRSSCTPAGDGEAWDRACRSDFMPNADLAFGVLDDRALVTRRARARR